MKLNSSLVYFLVTSGVLLSLVTCDQALETEREADAASIRSKKYFLFDLDGTIYCGSKAIPGAKETIQWLHDNGKKVMFLTNSASKTAEQYQEKLSKMGIDIPISSIYSAGMATAEFLGRQSKKKTAFILAGSGMHAYMKEQGFTHTEEDPEYVLVGSSKPSYLYGDWSFDLYQKAMQMVQKGSILITSSPDLVGVNDHGASPGVGAVAAVIEAATGKSAFSVGKPNAYIFAEALARIGGNVNEAVMIGDNLDTDVLGGISSGMTAAFVLTGKDKEADILKRSFRPTYVLDSVADIRPKHD